MIALRLSGGPSQSAGGPACGSTSALDSREGSRSCCSGESLRQVRSLEVVRRAPGSGIYRLVCQVNRPMRLTQAELEAHPVGKTPSNNKRSLEGPFEAPHATNCQGMPR